MLRDKDGNVIRNEDGSQVGSVDHSLDAEADTEEVDADDGEEDLSKLHKADLVARAEAAGVDTTGMTKAELVDALESGEEVTDGNDELS